MTKLLKHLRCLFLPMGYAYAIQLNSTYGYKDDAEYLMKELKKLREECCK